MSKPGFAQTRASFTHFLRELSLSSLQLYVGYITSPLRYKCEPRERLNKLLTASQQRNQVILPDQMLRKTSKSSAGKSKISRNSTDGKVTKNY
jgi:hypothetical protein